MYQFKCNLFDTGSYVGCTCGHLYARVDGHNSTSSSVRKHYDNDHAGSVPKDLLSCNFNVYFNLESHNFKASRRASRFKASCRVSQQIYIICKFQRSVPKKRNDDFTALDNSILRKGIQ